MSIAFIPDLRASLDLGCAITIRTSTGKEFLTGVKDLNEDDEYVVVYRPVVNRDVDTTETMLLSDIVSVTLHLDTAW